LQAKWSNKQKTKVLCIKVHFIHFYPSNECCVKRHSFFPQLVCVYCVCVCVLFFSHTSKAKTQNLFLLLGMGGEIICKRDRWWVYWLLIVYTLLLPWQFSTLIYIFFQKCWNFQFFFFFPPKWQKNLKENTEHSRKFYLVETIFQITYLFIWQTLVQPAKVIVIPPGREGGGEFQPITNYQIKHVWTPSDTHHTEWFFLTLSDTHHNEWYPLRTHPRGYPLQLVTPWH